MQKRLILAFVIAALLAAGLAGAQAPSRTPAGAALEMLEDIHANGLNADPALNGGLGGLWINWRYGSRPLQVNLNGTGAPDGDAVKPERHDVLTDLRYLHDLYLYKKLSPADTRFDGDIARFRKIAELEWTDTHNERGWLYDELIDMARLSGDPFFKQTARGLAANYAAGLAKSPAGVIFKKNAKHAQGYYRVDLALETGCALIQAGVEFGEPKWIETGRKTLKFVYEHAYVSKFHVFGKQMDEVLLADGGVNPNEKFYSDQKMVTGGEVRMGEAGQMITSLLHVHEATHEKEFLDRALELLQPMLPETNTLGLWDPEHLGYFASVKLSGKDFKNPGELAKKSPKKECGRQLHMLEGVMLANEATGHRYQALEDAILRVALEKAYDAPGHGYMYEKAADWSYLRMPNGSNGDWVTAEAMEIATQVLLKLELHKKK